MPNFASDAMRSDQLQSAVTQAMKQYPWLKKMNVPIKLVTGKGPYMSESYDPKAEDNPHPGNFTVQLRDPRIVSNPSTWPSLLGREGMDYMARHDPTFQSTAQQFRQLMTPQQVTNSQARYTQEKTQGETRDFEGFMKGAQLQEYLGGYVMNEPGWKDAGWTPEQRQLLDKLKAYMYQGQPQTPAGYATPPPNGAQ